MTSLNMKKFSDSDIELISLWHSEPKASYCNADARRAALGRMRKELDIDIGR